MSVEYFFFFINVLLPTLSCPFFFLQKRRSNRQVKRKKYAEELEARLSDDEVKVIVKTKKTNTAASKQPALQLFVVSSSANSSVVAQKGQFAFILVCFFWENQRAKRLKPHRVHCIAFKSQFYKVSGSSQTTGHAKDCFFLFFFLAIMHINYRGELIYALGKTKSTFWRGTTALHVKWRTAQLVLFTTAPWRASQDPCSMPVHSGKMHIRCPLLINEMQQQRN